MGKDWGKKIYIGSIIMNVLFLNFDQRSSWDT